MKRALEGPIRQICSNAGVEASIVVQKVLEGKNDFGYDARQDEYVNMFKAGIIDPAKVARVAVENAASISGLLLTTEAAITEQPEEHDHSPMPGGAPDMGMGGMGDDVIDFSDKYENKIQKTLYIEGFLFVK